MDSLPQEIDQNGLQVLDRDTCLRLLRRGGVGRVAVSWRTMPTIVPVNFALHHDSLVIKTGWSSLLGAGLANRIIAFQVDEIDARWHQGWSISVTGRAQVLTEPDQIAWARLLPLRPWAPGEKELFVAIGLDIVSGRCLAPS